MRGSQPHHNNSSYGNQTQPYAEQSYPAVMMDRKQDIPTYHVPPAVVQQHFPQQAFQQPMGVVNAVSELVPVPDELNNWVTSGQIQPTLLQVKEQSGAGYITIETDENGKISILIHAASPNTASTARLLLEIHMKEQKKFMGDVNRLNKMQENLFEVQGEVAAGQRIEFHVPTSVVGYCIGKSGRRIKQVKELTGVHQISIDGDTGLVRIAGRDAASVQAARDQLNIVEVDVELTNTEAITMLKDQSYLADLKEMSKCIDARIPYRENFVKLVGSESCVNSAKLILQTQKDYITKRQQVRESEGAIRSQLRTLDRNSNQYERSNVSGRYGSKTARNGAGNRRKASEDSLQNLNSKKDARDDTDARKVAKATQPAVRQNGAIRKSDGGQARAKSSATGKEEKVQSKVSETVTTSSTETITEKVASISINNDSNKDQRKDKRTKASNNDSDYTFTMHVDEVAAKLAKGSQRSLLPGKQRFEKRNSNSLADLPKPPPPDESDKKDDQKETSASAPLPPRRNKNKSTMDKNTKNTTASVSSQRDPSSNPNNVTEENKKTPAQSRRNKKKEVSRKDATTSESVNAQTSTADDKSPPVKSNKKKTPMNAKTEVESSTSGDGVRTTAVSAPKPSGDEKTGKEITTKKRGTRQKSKGDSLAVSTANAEKES